VEFALQQQTPSSKNRTESARTLKRTCNCPGLGMMKHPEAIRPDGLKDVTPQVTFSRISLAPNCCLLLWAWQTSTSS